jgi:7,8-dihydroneopterin aldolase/epimerase/oxygenase
MYTTKKVKLNNLKIHAFHGFYSEEQKIGNDFLINVEVTLELKDELTDKLENTLDYGLLYEIIADEMKQTSKLLEDVLGRIVNKIAQIPHTPKSVLVSIQKLNPPLGANCYSSEVVVEKTFY